MFSSVFLILRAVWGFTIGLVSSVFKWLIAHPVVLGGIVVFCLGFAGGHWWEARSADKAIAKLQKQSDDYFAQLKVRQKEIEDSSKAKGDELDAAEAKGRASADGIIEEYKQRLKDATDPKNAKHTIDYVKVYIPVPAVTDNKGKVTTPATTKQVDVMVENGQVVATRLPQVTVDTINQLIESANKNVPVPVGPAK